MGERNFCRKVLVEKFFLKKATEEIMSRLWKRFHAARKRC